MKVNIKVFANPHSPLSAQVHPLQTRHFEAAGEFVEMEVVPSISRAGSARGTLVRIGESGQFILAEGETVVIEAA